MSGCFAILGFGFFGLLYLISRMTRRPHGPQDDALIRMLQDFVAGHDQSQEHVNRIHHLLMTKFAREPAFEDVTTASGSFISNGSGNFHDEASLSTEFRAFLRTQYGIAKETQHAAMDVLPPPPK